tara:strand:+ start:1043 stop:1309 length:267 start_codon:yes stop_codon:yes gene_type:complete
MKFIKDFLYNREINSIKKKITRLQSEAVSHQRNGKLRYYAELMKEIEDLSDLLVEKLDRDKKQDYVEPVNDTLDYDGMGNQGRFPEEK